MKTGLKIFIVMVLVMIGATSVVNAQKHRHSERNDSTEAAILSESRSELEEGVPVIDNLEESIEEFSEKLERMASNYDGKKFFDFEGDNLLVSFIKGMVALTVIVLVIIILILIFGAPIVALGVFVWFVVWLCKPNKKKEQQAAPVAQPIDVVEMKSERKAKQIETMLQKAIMEMFIGIGLYIVSIILSSRVFAAIGAFMVIYGSGRCLIAKITKKQNEKPE